MNISIFRFNLIRDIRDSFQTFLFFLAGIHILFLRLIIFITVISRLIRTRVNRHGRFIYLHSFIQLGKIFQMFCHF